MSDLGQLEQQLETAKKSLSQSLAATWHQGSVVPLWCRPIGPIYPGNPRLGTGGTHGTPENASTPQPVDWGSKGRWFKSSRPDVETPTPRGHTAVATGVAEQGVRRGFANKTLTPR